MKFPDPGMQAAQRAQQEFQRQQQTYRRMNGWGRSRSGGSGCSTLISLVFFLLIVVFVGYVFFNGGLSWVASWLQSILR